MEISSHISSQSLIDPERFGKKMKMLFQSTLTTVSGCYSAFQPLEVAIWLKLVMKLFLLDFRLTWKWTSLSGFGRAAGLPTISLYPMRMWMTRIDQNVFIIHKSQICWIRKQFVLLLAINRFCQSFACNFFYLIRRLTYFLCLIWTRSILFLDYLV